MTPFCTRRSPTAEREPAEHADAELVDVERVVLGDREAVAGRLVELLELGELVGIAGQLRPRLGEQLLALADRLPVQQLGILGVVQADEAGDARHRDRLVLTPRDVGEVVDGVAAPPELLEERAQLLVERAAVVGLVELGHDLVRRLLGEELRQRRAVLHDPTERPHRAADVDRSGVEALQRLVRLGRLARAASPRRTCRRTRCWTGGRS